MATERCPQCGRGLRDGECTSEDCGYVPGPGLRLVKPAVDRPHPPTQIPPRPDRPALEVGPPTATERQTGIPWVQRCRQTLAEHEPPQESTTRARLRAVAAGDGRPKAQTVAAEILNEVDR